MSDTRVTLREYVESLIERARGEIQHAREVALMHVNSMERNVKTAEIALQHRLEKDNEIRAQLTEQAERLASKEYVKGLELRVDELREQREKWVTRDAFDSLENHVQELAREMATGAGRRQGHQPITALAMIVASAVVSGAVAAVLLWVAG